jgi:uncharacterized membrane protein YeaQ/YmgE (transglycosylase-associated protein family)
LQAVQGFERDTAHTTSVFGLPVPVVGDPLRKEVSSRVPSGTAGQGSNGLEGHARQTRKERSMETGAAVGGVIGILIAGVIGLLIGAVAKLLMPGKDPGGWFVTMLLGIAGSWVGAFLAGALGLTGGLGLLGAVLGAMLLLLIYRLLKKS